MKKKKQNFLSYPTILLLKNKKEKNFRIFSRLIESQGILDLATVAPRRLAAKRNALCEHRMDRVARRVSRTSYINFSTTSVSTCRGLAAIVLPAIRSRVESSTGRPPPRGQFELCWQPKETLASFPPSSRLASRSKPWPWREWKTNVRERRRKKEVWKTERW